MVSNLLSLLGLVNTFHQCSSLRFSHHLSHQIFSDASNSFHLVVLNIPPEHSAISCPIVSQQFPIFSTNKNSIPRAPGIPRAQPRASSPPRCPRPAPRTSAASRRRRRARWRWSPRARLRRPTRSSLARAEPGGKIWKPGGLAKVKDFFQRWYHIMYVTIYIYMDVNSYIVDFVA